MRTVFHCNKLTSKISHVKYFNNKYKETDFMVRVNHKQNRVKMMIIVKEHAVFA
jgi:hypothetical protein